MSSLISPVLGLTNYILSILEDPGTENYRRPRRLPGGPGEKLGGRMKSFSNERSWNLLLSQLTKDNFEAVLPPEGLMPPC